MSKLLCLRAYISETIELNKKKQKLNNFLRSFQIRKDPTSDIGTLRTSMNTEQHGARYRCVTSKTRVMGVREGKN